MLILTSSSPLSIAAALALVVISLFLAWRLNRKRNRLGSKNLVIVIDNNALKRLRS